MNIIKFQSIRQYLALGCAALLFSSLSYAGYFEVKNSASDTPTIATTANKTFASGYDQLEKYAGDSTPRSTFIYALKKSANEVDVFQDSSLDSQQLSWVRTLSDTNTSDFDKNGYATTGVFTGATQLAIEPVNGRYLAVARQVASEPGLFVTYRGDSTSNNSEPGSGVKLAKFKKNETSATSAFTLSEFEGFQVQDMAFVADGKSLVVVGTNSAGAGQVVAITGLEASGSSTDPVLLYSEILTYTATELDAPKHLALPINVTGLNHIFVANNSSTAANDAIFHLKYTSGSPSTLTLKSKKALAEPSDIASYYDGSSAYHIYVGSNGMTNSGSAVVPSIAWLKYLDVNPELTFNQLIYLNGTSNYPNFTTSVDGVKLLSTRLLVLTSTSESKLAVLSVTTQSTSKGLPVPLYDSTSASASLDTYNQGVSSTNSVANPSTVLFSGSQEVIYVSSADANTKGIGRISRSADMSLSVTPLNSKIEPGRSANFKVTIKNNGTNDIPLLNVYLESSHTLVSVSGDGASSCTEYDSKPYTLCEPAQAIKAGKSFEVTFTMLPSSVGTAWLKATTYSFHATKGSSATIAKVASMTVGDYNNGTLSFSLWSGLVLLILTLTRKFLRHE